MLFEINTALMALALITPRVFVCLSVLPGFGTRTLTGMSKTAVCIAIALPAVVPTYLALDAAPPPVALAGVWAFKEAAIGLVLGMLLAIPIWVLQCVGSLYDLQRVGPYWLQLMWTALFATAVGVLFTGGDRRACQQAAECCFRHCLHRRDRARRALRP